MTTNSEGPAGLVQSIASRADGALIPTSLAIEVTRRCELNCVHCYAKGERAESPRPELSTARWVDLLEQAAGLGALYLAVTGGEPLRRTDIFEILDAARRLHYAVRLLTNGTLIDAATADRLARLAPLSVEVSLYGVDRWTHDLITGVGGSHEQTLTGMRLLVERGVKVVAKTPVMRSNLAEIDELFELGEVEGFSVRVDPMITPSDTASKAPLAKRLDADGVAELARVLAARGIAMGGTERLPSDPPCSAGRTVAAITSSGILLPCIGFPVAAGDVVARPLAEVWRTSEVLKSIRAMRWDAQADCAGCGAAPYCRRCPGLAYLECGSAQAVPPFVCAVAHSFECVGREGETNGQNYTDNRSDGQRIGRTDGSVEQAGG